MSKHKGGSKKSQVSGTKTITEPSTETSRREASSPHKSANPNELHLPLSVHTCSKDKRKQVSGTKCLVQPKSRYWTRCIEFFHKNGYRLPDEPLSEESSCQTIQHLIPDFEHLLPDASVIDIMGQGSYGCVLLCSDPKGVFVVKCVKASPTAFNSPQQEYVIQNFFYALGLAPRIREFKHIRPPSGKKRHGTMSLLVQDHMDVRLSDVLRCALKLPEPDQIRFLDQVLFYIKHIISTLYKNNVAHGDLHMNNIMLKYNPGQNGQWTVKLIDFGIASLKLAHPWVEAAQFIRDLVKTFPEQKQWHYHALQVMNLFLHELTQHAHTLTMDDVDKMHDDLFRDYERKAFDEMD